jgi:iron complex outermembrane receptor protein
MLAPPLFSSGANTHWGCALNRRKQFCWLLVAVCAAGYTVLPMARAADSTSASDAGGLQEVTVTARRVEENIQDVPMSISVYSQADLANRNIVSLNDLSAYAPALSINNEFGSEGASLIIRGFSQDIGTSPTVGTYFGDVVAPRGGFGGSTVHAGEGAGPGSFFDLQNLQILKGPQGTLFGRNTTGGAILLVPQKPTGEFSGYVEGSAGDFNLERAQAVVNIPVNDRLRLRLGIDQQSQAGYVTNISDVGPRDLYNVHYISGRISAVFDVTKNIENYTIASFTRSDNNGVDSQLVGCNADDGLIGALACAQLASEGANRRPWTVDNSLANSESYTQQWQIINTTTWNATDHVSFKNIASYSQLRSVIDTGLFGTNFQIGGLPLQFSVEDTPPGTDLTSQQSITEEPRLYGTALNGRLTWQTGLYYEMSFPKGVSGSSSPNLLNCADFQQLQCFDVAAAAFGLPQGAIGNVVRRLGTITWRDYGVYAQDTYNFNEQFALTTGVRYSYDLTTDETNRYSYLFPAPNTPVQSCEAPFPVTPTCTVNDRQKSSAPTGLVNFQYRPFDDLLTYAQYSRGYRQGGLLVSGPYEHTRYEPEHLNAYELGVKSTLHGPVSGVINAAIFYNDFGNQQLLGTFASSVPGATPNAGILNVGKSRIAGLDLDSALELFRGLSINLGYTYLNTKLVKVDAEAVSGFYDVFGPNEPQGSQLALTPQNKLSVTPNYRLPLSDRIGKVSLGATWTYTSRQLAYGYGPFSHIPATNLLNLNAAWASVFGSPVDVSFFMTNVTNKLYPTNIDNFANPAGSGAAAYGLIAENFGPPRMYGFRVRYRFPPVGR